MVYTININKITIIRIIILIIIIGEIMHNDNYYYNLIRTNIKKYRIKANLTQQELADKAGITMNYLSKIESERMNRGFSVVIIGRIADALEIDIRKLFEPIEKD